jgi:hypothetical protein
VALDEAAFIGFFPDRESRTGRTPGLHDLLIVPPFGADPFKEIEDQSVNRR